MAEMKSILKVSRVTEPMSFGATRAKRRWTVAGTAGLGKGGGRILVRNRSLVGGQQLLAKHVTRQEQCEKLMMRNEPLAEKR